MTTPWSGVITLSGTQKPLLGQTGAIGGTLTGSGAMNYIALNDSVAAGSWLYGLQVVDSVVAPAVGLRNAIYGHVTVTGAGTNTVGQAQYVGVAGRAELNTSLGASGAPAGSLWGGWFYGALNNAPNCNALYGVEIDVSVGSGSSVGVKTGLVITLAGSDAVQGTLVDAALSIAKQGPVTNTWKTGILFGAQGAGNWAFNDTSTLIAAATGPANVGVDFSRVTFTGPAIKLPAAPISMAPMASAPAAAKEGQLYVAADGSLHYRGPHNDTQVARA